MKSGISRLIFFTKKEYASGVSVAYPSRDEGGFFIMAWIKSHQDLKDHPKLLMLCQKTGLSKAETIMKKIMLFILCIVCGHYYLFCRYHRCEWLESLNTKTGIITIHGNCISHRHFPDMGCQKHEGEYIQKDKWIKY